MKKLRALILFCAQIIVCQQEPSTKFDMYSLESWENFTGDRAPARSTSITYHAFEDLLEKYLAVQKNFLHASLWFGPKLDIENETLKNDLKAEFEPFALKLAIGNGGIGYFWGDLHGDIQALLVTLKILKNQKVIDDAFKVINAETYFFFLGDMIDRGRHQIETLSLLLIFALQNPGKVFLIRGNHEDMYYGQERRLLDGDTSGFLSQLRALLHGQRQKLHKDSPILKSVGLLFNLMPDVAFVGCDNNYLQCCHGGIEIRYNPKELLAQPTNMIFQQIKKSYEGNTFLRNIFKGSQIKNSYIDNSALDFFAGIIFQAEKPFIKSNFGFLWGDFNNDVRTSYTTFYNPGRGLFAGKDFTQAVLNYYSTDKIRVRGIMRAHQHNSTLLGLLNPLNGGMYSIWDGTVFTNLSSSFITDIIGFNRIQFFKDYDAWILSNYAIEDTFVIKVKENVLVKWKNNIDYVAPLGPSESQQTISEVNRELLLKVNDEMENAEPDYAKINKLLLQAQEDPDDPENREYVQAQDMLKIFRKFTKALEFFRLKDYDLAMPIFKKLADTYPVSYKSREYYARAVEKGLMDDQYTDAEVFLNKTLNDPSAPIQDQAVAVPLLENIKKLIQWTISEECVD